MVIKIKIEEKTLKNLIENDKIYININKYKSEYCK